MFDIISYTEWLYTKLYQNDYFFLDLWSFVHLWFGFIITVILLSKKVKKLFIILLSLLLFYEVLEILIAYFALGIFKPETFKDQFTDIVVGMTGGLVAAVIIRYYTLNVAKKTKNLEIGLMLFASFTYAFCWVGFYGYAYNIEFFNSKGINWFAWLLWTTGSFLSILFFSKLSNYSFLFNFLTTWAVYFFVLLLVELIGYHLLNIQEISEPRSKALVFNLIHGTSLLHFFYVFSPFFFISLFLIVKKLFFKALKKAN